MVVEPSAVELPTAEPSAVELPTAEPSAVELPTAESPRWERTAAFAEGVTPVSDESVDEATLRSLYWTHGLTQTEIAELLGISQPTVSNLLNRFDIETRSRGAVVVDPGEPPASLDGLSDDDERHADDDPDDDRPPRSR